MKIIILLILFTFANSLLLFVYCRLERIVDEKKFVRISKYNTKDSIQTQTQTKSIIKRVYHYINSYLYGWMRFNVILVGKIPSYRIRNLLYRLLFAMRITSKTVIFGGCEFRSPWNISIGKSVISANCILDGRGKIRIEDNVVLGSGVHVWTEEHSVNDPYFRVLKSNLGEVVIKKYAWICSDSTILPGITVNEGVVIATRACVVSDCEEYGVYVGIPAHKKSMRNKDLRYELSGKPSWHFM